MKILKTSIAVAIAICSVLVSMPASAQRKPKLSDPEIASVAVVANQVDIKAAELAKTKIKNKEVLDFTNLMMKDHQSVVFVNNDRLFMIVIEDANYHCSFDVVMKGKLLVRKLLSHFPKDLNKGKFIINN